MKILLKTVLFFLVLFLINIQPQFVSAAEVYKIRPALLVPVNKKDYLTDEKKAQYKTYIFDALKEVQEFYKQELNGKTFNLDNDWDIVYSDKPIDVTQDLTAVKYFYRSGGDNKLPLSDGLIRTIWIIGLSNQGPIAGEGFALKSSGNSFFDHGLLLDLGRTNSEYRDRGLTVIAHELGHAFGLVESKFAYSHTCTEDNPAVCKNNPSPLPPKEISYFDIMNWTITGEKFTQKHFTNDYINQEKTGLYKSLFINPQKDSAPSIENLSGSLDKPKFFNLSPNTVIIGQSFDIIGVGLSEFDQVEIYNLDTVLPSAAYKIIEHKNDVISILINNDDSRFPKSSETKWNIRLIGKNNLKMEIPIELIIKGTQVVEDTIDADNSIPTAFPTANEPIVQQVVSQEVRVITISNYNDFRLNNEVEDIGSPTEIVQSGSSVVWTLPTLDSKPTKRIYIQETGEYFDLTDGQEIEVGGVHIQVQLPKKIVKMTITINGQNQAIDLNNSSGINVRLAGLEGKAQIFYLPCIIEYSNGDITGQGGIPNCVIKINYNPPSVLTPEEIPTASTEPTARNFCEEEGYRKCSNIGASSGLGSCEINGQECTKYETYQCNFNGDAYCGDDSNNPECRGPCKSLCTEGEVVRNECIQCNVSQQICKHADCSEYVCKENENNASCNWFDCPVPTPKCIGKQGIAYNPGDYERECTKRCIYNGCYPGDYTGGEQIFRQCDADGNWGDYQSECSTRCDLYCLSEEE